MQDIKLTYQRLNDLVILLNSVSNQTLSDVFPRLGSRAPARCEILSSELSEALDELSTVQKTAQDKYDELVEEIEGDDDVDDNAVQMEANKRLRETDEYKAVEDKLDEEVTVEVGNNKHEFLKQLVDKAGVKVFDKPNGKKALSDFYTALGMEDKIWEEEE